LKIVVAVDVYILSVTLSVSLEFPWLSIFEVSMVAWRPKFLLLNGFFVYVKDKKIFLDLSATGFLL